MLTKRECKRNSRLLWDFISERLSARDSARVEEHLRRCPACRQMREDYRQTALMVKSYRERPVPVMEDDWREVRFRLEALQPAASSAPQARNPWVALGGAALAILLLFLLVGGAQRPNVPPGKQMAATTNDRSILPGPNLLPQMASILDSVGNEGARIADLINNHRHATVKRHRIARHHRRHHSIQRDVIHGDETHQQIAKSYGPPLPPVEEPSAAVTDRICSVDGDRPDPASCQASALVLGTPIAAGEESGPKRFVLDDISVPSDSVGATRVASLRNEAEEQRVW